MLPGLVISFISLAVVFYFADLRQMATAVRLADYRFVAAGAMLTLVWLVVRAFVWRTLLQEKATLRQTFLTINEGYLINNILPFRLGEVARAFLLGRKADLGFWQVFSTILLERALDLAFAAGLLLATLPFVVGATWARQAALLAGALVVVGLGLLYLLARFRRQALALFEALSARWPLLQKAGGASLNTFFDGLAVLNDGSRFLQAVGWMALDWVIAISQYFILMRAFFPQAKLLWGAFSLGVGALGIAAPSSPGAVGVMELTLVGALALFGLNSSTALAFALTAHLNQYILTGILGAYGLAQDGETLAGLYRQVRRIPEKDANG